MPFRDFIIFVALAFVSACATDTSISRTDLVNPETPFGLSWSLTSDQRDVYLEKQKTFCEDLFAADPSLRGDELADAVEPCIGNPVIYELPETKPPSPLENGHMRVVFRRNGEVLEHAYVFGGYFGSSPRLSDQEIEDRDQIIANETSAWAEALIATHGHPDANGKWDMWSGFVQSEAANASCTAWHIEPVAIVLCNRRRFTVDASEASLSFLRLDRIQNGADFRKEIIGE